MKKYLLILAVIVMGCSLHRELKVPAVQFQYIDHKTNPYVKLLHLKDSNALILKTCIKDYSSPYAGDFLVKDSNGNLTFYMLVTGDRYDTLLYSRKLPKVQRDSLSNVFAEAASVNKAVVEDYTGAYVSDGDEIELELYQNRYFTKICSFYPEFYVNENIGMEERKKLLAVVKKVGRVSQLPAKNIKDIEKFDTLYVHFTYDKLQTKEPRFKNVTIKEYRFWRGSLSSDVFFQQGKDSVAVTRNFLKTHEKQIVDYFFFLKNHISTFQFKKKTVILIDDNGKELYLKKVQHVRPFK
ncbi:hypothetical protein ACLI1A_14575 [Flavobacterium sp. RHBU_3]|uniref:hypothetical protein n=1 Tax=Flavobacterium sp. RHBU_3 TaxID=3391184 RepID=UPI0039849BEE